MLDSWIGSISNGAHIVGATRRWESPIEILNTDGAPRVCLRYKEAAGPSQRR
jgi:hypothetical protein